MHFHPWKLILMQIIENTCCGSVLKIGDPPPRPVLVFFWRKGLLIRKGVDQSWEQEILHLQCVSF